jgi:hypothetical protein
MQIIPSTDQSFTGANSYISATQASEIIKDSDWDGLAGGIKESLLIRASGLVDGFMQYQGKRTDDNQLLKFPRDGKKTIPAGVQYATALLAQRISEDDAFKGLKSEKIGKLAWEFKDGNQEIGEEIATFLNRFKMRSIKIK